jgi:pimeloyl-ACP methyl ester carboxylesterase
MQPITTRGGIRVAFELSGNGPNLVLVHGSFSDHASNWPRVKPLLEAHAAGQRWDAFARTFFREALQLTSAALDGLCGGAAWAGIVADAPATFDDIRALRAAAFAPARFGSLPMPVLLQIGSESPRPMFATDALAAVLPDAHVETLEGQGHDGMNTAPQRYAGQVRGFPLGPRAALAPARLPGAAVPGEVDGMHRTS